MIGKLTPDDPKPNSDQGYCQNCEMIVDELDIIKTVDGESGCVNCIDRCGWCGNYYFREELYDNPYLGFCCDACLNAEDYNKASDAEIEKHSLRCLFDSTCSKEIENQIIKLAWKKGYYEFVDEMRNDK